MITANPYIYLDGNIEEAFTFYESIFGGAIEALMRFRDFPDNPMGISGSDLDRIAHISLPIGRNSMLMGTDHLDAFPEKYNPGNNFCIVLEVECVEKAEKLFEALSLEGEIKCPLKRTQWAERYGECADKFGVRWMVNCSGAAMK